MTLEGFGSLLVFLYVGREAERLTHILDFCKPFVLAVGRVVNLKIFCEDSLYVCLVKLFVKPEVGCVKSVVKIAYIVLYFIPLGNVLTGLGALTVYIEHGC